LVTYSGTLLVPRGCQEHHPAWLPYGIRNWCEWRQDLRLEHHGPHRVLFPSGSVHTHLPLPPRDTICAACPSTQGSAAQCAFQESVSSNSLYLQASSSRVQLPTVHHSNIGCFLKERTSHNFITVYCHNCSVLLLLLIYCS
jgi:hypothetical protein